MELRTGTGMNGNDWTELLGMGKSKTVSSYLYVTALISR